MEARKEGLILQVDQMVDSVEGEIRVLMLVQVIVEDVQE